MSQLTHLSLFSGIGGLDLAAEWAGFHTVGQCEWADYPRKVLEKHWPGLPRWRDIRTLTKESFYEQTGLDTVTVLSGGFPCQPFSTAGKRRGKEDDRYLWPEMLRVIQEIRPSWVVGENVAGIVSLALDTVLSDLESIGYTCQALIIPACAVDAPHRRDRCAILAHTNDAGNGAPRHGYQEWAEESQKWKHPQHWSSGCRTFVADTESQRRGEARSGIGRPEERVAGSSAVMADAKSERRQIDGAGGEQITKTRCSKRESAWRCAESASHTDNEGLQISGLEPGIQAVQSKNGIEFGGWWSAEPDVGRVAHGIPFRVDKLRCLGNAVVPQQFFPIFQAIAELEAVG